MFAFSFQTESHASFTSLQSLQPTLAVYALPVLIAELEGRRATLLYLLRPTRFAAPDTHRSSQEKARDLFKFSTSCLLCHKSPLLHHLTILPAYSILP